MSFNEDRLFRLRTSQNLSVTIKILILDLLKSDELNALGLTLLKDWQNIYYRGITTPLTGPDGNLNP